MNFIEYNPLIIEGIHRLGYTSQYVSNAGDSPYRAQNLNLLRQVLVKLENVPLINTDIEFLKQSWLFGTSSDSLMISISDNSVAQSRVDLIRTKLTVLKELNESTGLLNQDDLLYIKLPELSSFDELSKYANDLKKAIELPITDESINGNLKIIGADQGSVILYALLGTVVAVKLIAGICWAAVLLKKKNAEANIFEAHAKTLNIKNELMQDLVNAQKEQIKNILHAEAEAIASKHYNHNEPETIERLKLSIATVSELVEKGAKILPMHNNDEIQKSFPDYNATNLIESTIRQLKEGNL
jgi:hypothetical protein